MRDTYAIQFQICTDNACETIGKLKNDLNVWIARWYVKWESKNNIEIPFMGGTVIPAKNHIIEIKSSPIHDKVSHYWSLSWTFPGTENSGHIWQIITELSTDGNTTIFMLKIRIGSSNFIIKPTSFNLQPPHIVKHITQTYNCSINTRGIVSTPRSIDANTTRDFVNNELLSPDRALPIILISPDSWDGSYPIDCDKFAQKCAGLAEVWFFENKWATFPFTDIVGRNLSCFNAGLRIYWPGFSRNDQPHLHRLYTAQKRDSFFANNNDFIDLIFNQLCRISAFRCSEHPITKESKKNWLKDQDNASTTRVEEIRKSLDNEFTDIFDELAADNDRLRNERNESNAKIEELETKLAAAQLNLQDAWSYADDQGNPIKPDSLPEIEKQPDSIINAVNIASEDCKNHLIFTKNACKSASKSPFKRPNEVLRAFMALEDVGYILKKQNDEPDVIDPNDKGKTLKQLLKDRGFKYKPKVSMTSGGKWSEQYQAQYHGTKIDIQPHITIGSGQPDTCISIHFAIDNDNNMFIIDHVGIHKKNTTT